MIQKNKNPAGDIVLYYSKGVLRYAHKNNTSFSGKARNDIEGIIT